MTGAALFAFRLESEGRPEVAVIDEAAPAMTNWLTTTQASHRLDISANWVRTLVTRGALRATQTPHGALIDPQSVTDMVRARQDGSRGAAVKV